MKIKSIKILSIITVLLIASLFVATKSAQAAVRCETQYGGGQVCVRTGQLQVNKRVLDPDSKTFVDNLGLSSKRFRPSDEITFKIEVKNVGDATFNKVTVTDTLPSRLELVSGSLTFDLTNLTAGQTESRDIKVRVVSADRFPSDQSVICDVNTAGARSDTNESDRDTAQVCLEKVAGQVTLPKAGPQGWFLTLLLSTIAGATGIYLTKFSKLNS